MKRLKLAWRVYRKGLPLPPPPTIEVSMQMLDPTRPDEVRCRRFHFGPGSVVAFTDLDNKRTYWKADVDTLTIDHKIVR